MKKTIILVLVLITTVCYLGLASDLSNKSEKITLNKNLKFKDTTLKQVLAKLSQETGIKLVAVDSANLQVTLKLNKGQTLKEIIEIIKKKYGLKIAIGNNQFKFFRVKYVEEAEPTLKKEVKTSRTSGMMLFGFSRNDRNFNTEEYSRIYENEFLSPLDNPLSTFSIDIDTASYSNLRRFINDNRLPPKDAVRVEELINYFNYDYKKPQDETPFSINTEIAQSPWNKENKLALIALQGKEVETKNLPPSNLVFLLDVSGSMNSQNKLPLLKRGFKLLVNNLRAKDRVAIVVYAGRSAVVLDSTPANQKEKILNAINNLNAGGSTAGSVGIKKAYQIAKQNFMPEGNNRVILATDGDFNVGVSSTGALVRLIEEKRKSGVYLSVLGFGRGNYKGSKMEELSNKGNGNYAYIDNLLEAKKVLVNEIGGTLLTIAKDVKIQVEFNPAWVKEYRLIGYENRKLNDKDFADDKKDAGELGAGHSVTALYEIIPAQNPNSSKSNLKYQQTKIKDKAYQNQELMTVKLRYKSPEESKSKLITKAVFDKNDSFKEASNNLCFASAVAEFGMLLRDSKFKANSSYQQVLNLARGAKGNDKNGYRAEFINLVEKVELILETSN